MLTNIRMKKEKAKKESVKKIKKIESEVVSSPVISEVVAPTTVIEDENFDMESLSEKDLSLKSDRYFEAVGRRKTAVARIRLFTKGDKEFLVNNKPYKEYFPIAEDQEKAISSMEKMKCFGKFRVTVIVRGGGRSAQAEAVRHGTARVLVDFNNNFKKRLRKVGYLTRDPRMRERKKFGLKRARKSPQWAKR